MGDVIEEIDAALGRIAATLQAEGIATNTLLIVTSDNGPWVRFHYETGNARYGDARLDPGYAEPFGDGKGSTWEGGVREFGFLWWPGTIAPARVERRSASTLDLLPTVFALAGAALPTGRTLDGRDLRPYLDPTRWTGPVPEFSFVYTGNAANAVYGARKGPWKLHIALYSQTGNQYGYTGVSLANPLLFQVEHDPGERHNLAASEPGQVTELRGVINAFNASLGAEQTFWGPP